MNKELTTWIEATLQSPIIGLTTIADTPWSVVFKINTINEIVYLKRPAPALCLEPAILEKCRSLCQIHTIPIVIAENKPLNSFLMQECGHASLRTLFDGQLNSDFLVRAIHVYRLLQSKTAPYITDFIALGVPDWRCSNLSLLYQSFANDIDFLMEEGLTSAQIIELQLLSVKVAKLSYDLDSYSIPASLNNADFHDNNLVVNSNGDINIIDLGETAIDHPFLSLTAFLKRTRYRYHLRADSVDYEKLHNACFSGWPLTAKDLQDAIAITQKLLPFYSLLTHRRLVQATDPALLQNVERMRGRIKRDCLSLIEDLKNYN